MTNQINKQDIRKHCTIRMDPEVLRKVRLEALRSRKTMGQWLEEIIEERIGREQSKVKSG